MNDRPDTIEQLQKRLEALEQRVQALEHPLAARWPPSAPAQANTLESQSVAALSAAPSGNIFSVLGKALLGVAGAYVLRALEQTGSLPGPAAAAAGILYAFAWLVLAARTRAGLQFAGAIYSATSALILAPMVWELTLRFRVLSPAIASAVLCAFAVAALGLSWNRGLRWVLRSGFIAAAGIALALAIALHAFMPFIVALLVMAAICEFFPQMESAPEVRALVALAADAAIWILIYLYYAPQAPGEEFPSLGKAALIAPGLAIFLLFSASVSWQTIVRKLKIGAFTAVQTTIAFLLAAVSIADFGSQSSGLLIGVVCLALAAASYAAVFMIFEHAGEPRNAAVFSAWGAALLVAGAVLCLPLTAAAALLGVAAIAAAIVGGQNDRRAFEFYAMAFLLAGAAQSALPGFLFSALTGTPPGQPAPGVWLIACSAVACYAAVGARTGNSWMAQALHLGFAALAAGLAAAFLIVELMTLVALRTVPGPHHVAFVRTLVLCLVALAMVYAGSRWRRLELSRLGYAALALVAIKIVTEDLRHGRLAYIAGSIFLVAVTLIAAPRMARARPKPASHTQS
jgi:hypothetical protein